MYPTWYKVIHTAPEYLTEAVYGLPEIHREELQKTRLVANPGCYPTASILALLPLLRAGVVHTSGIVIDAKSGVSGAGRGGGGGFGFSETNEDVRAYSVTGHNHIAEIEQELSGLAGAQCASISPRTSFPLTRGILATTYTQLTSS